MKADAMNLLQTDYELISQIVMMSGARLVVSGLVQSMNMQRWITVASIPLTNTVAQETLFTFPERSVTCIDPSGSCFAGIAIREGANSDHLHLFDTVSATPSPSVRIEPHFRAITAIALSSGGTYLAIVGRPWNAAHTRLPERMLIVRDTASGVNRLELRTDDPIEEVSISSDGHQIAVTERYGLNLLLFDRHARKASPFELNHRDSHRVVFSPQNRLLASAGLSTRVWDAESRRQIADFRGQDEDVPDMAFSPDERMLAVARTDGAVEFWDFRQSRMIRSYSWGIGRLSAIAFAPDGLTCAVAGEGGKIVIWDVDA
jgi:WD40 repeat protein